MGKGPVAVVRLLVVALTFVSMTAHAQLAVKAYVTAHACNTNAGAVSAIGSGGTAPYEYAINGGPWQSLSNFVSLAPGVYTVSIREKNTPANTATATAVTVDNSCLQAVGTVTPAKCGQPNGEIIISGANGTGNYLYSFDGGSFVAGNIYQNRPPGTYIIGVQDQGTLKEVYSTVIVADQAGPSITSVDIIDADCTGNGGKVTINATGGTAALKYSIGGAYQSGNVFGPSVTPGPFTAYVSDANGCTDTKTGYEVRKLCLQITVLYKAPGCSDNDGEINVMAGGGSGSYEYFLGGVSNGSSPSWTGLSSGSYFINVVDLVSGFSVGAPATLPQVCLTASLTHTDASCGKNNGTITVTAGGVPNIDYSLDGINFQSDPTFTGLAPGPYTVTVRNSPTSFITLNATIQAVAQPTIQVTPTAATCANNDGVLQVSGSGGPQPYTYALDAGAYGASGTFDKLVSGPHTVSIKDAGGCVVSQSVTVPLTNNLTANGGPDVPVCEGTSGVIQAVSNGASFSWSPAAGLDDPHVLQPKVTPVADITYNLTATLGPCQLTVPVNVLFHPAPVASATPVDDICPGISTQLHGSGGGSYSWSPAFYLSNPAISDPVVAGLTQTTVYKLTVTDGNGCQSLAPAEVTVRVAPPPPILIGNDTSVLEGQTLTLHAVDLDNNGLANWRWSPPQGLDDPFSQDPVAHPPSSITYTVTAFTANGCRGTASIKVKVFTSGADIFVPNAFTPNGDGHNDLLRALPVGIKEFKYFAVFDRYGQRVFYTTNPANAWTGNIDGRPEPAGAYVWTALGTDINGVPVQRKGTVMLIR